MDDWDYLNKSLGEWLDDFVDPNISFQDALIEITAEYLPRFEAALHRNNARYN